jgi:glycogen(starch) synthase
MAAKLLFFSAKVSAEWIRDDRMKTLMLGWEFPPFISGGLGTACYGLTKAMDQLGINIVFVLPKGFTGGYTSHVKMLSTQGSVVTEKAARFKNVSFRIVASSLKPYAAAGIYERRPKHIQSCPDEKNSYVRSWHSDCTECVGNYGGNIYEEIEQYAERVTEIATLEDFDIVHAHDWMTYRAGASVAKQRHKPLIVHVHSTEFDRSGEHVNQIVYDIEREGMHAAVKTIAVSHYTKNIILSHYGLTPEKVEVVYNGIEPNGSSPGVELLDKTDRTVLFLGRITMQKGPEYFLAAAKKVLEKVTNVKFVMAGDGDMLHQSIELAAQMGIGHKVLFTRFLRGSEVDRAYRMADLYVMPSVSEPFGIAPLEALNHGVPVLISKQSGVSEVLQHALKVNFWDINQIANMIIAVLRYAPLRATLRQNGKTETYKLRWENAATRVKEIYSQVIATLAQVPF